MLHEASETDKPWLNGKTILGRAGSACTRMRDLFKSQPGWRRLIDSNGRGMYRLNVDMRRGDARAVVASSDGTAVSTNGAAPVKPSQPTTENRDTRSGRAASGS